MCFFEPLCYKISVLEFKDLLIRKVAKTSVELISSYIVVRI